MPLPGLVSFTTKDQGGVTTGLPFENAFSMIGGTISILIGATFPGCRLPLLGTGTFGSCIRSAPKVIPLFILSEKLGNSAIYKTRKLL